MTTRTACWSILALTVLGLGHAVDFGPCYRPCVAGDKRVCNYTFVEEMYTTMIPAACGACGQPGGEADCSLPGCVPADGVERTVYTINRLLPGPAIHVCLGDEVQVDFQNRLIGHGETLHWHGLHQRETPYMDGVSMITQCPVASGTSFQYRFSAAQPGTWFYHSHNGINKANGIEGTLVIRAPPSTSPKTELLYDEDLAEHTIFLIDWMHVDADTVFPGRHTPPVNQLPTSVLINGKGNFLDSNNTTPVEEFRVQRGRRYRFRIINSGTLSCPIVLQVVGHNMTLIAADGYDVKPQPIDTLYTYSGERYDVVLTADNDAANAFWIYAHSDELCSSATPADQVAVLRYVGDDKGDDAALPEGCTGKCRPSNKLKRGIVFNSPDCDSTSANKLCVSDLLDASPVSDKQLLGLEEATDSIVLDASFHSYTPEELFRSGTYPHFLTLDTAHVAGMLGNVTYESPSSPLLTQPGDAATCSSCEVGQDFCSCAHVIRVPLGSYYQMALVESSDNPAPSHPMHLHGYSFRVLAMGTLNSSLSGQERIQYVRDNTAQLLSSNYNSNPAAKDTVVLPKNGYVILRFKADNPGVWFFHCHYQYHMASGMEAAFQVGEAKDFQPVPPNFPKCGNYLTN